MASELAALTKQKEDLIQEILAYDNHGRRVYLIGSAEFGPVNEPIKVKSTVGLHNKFGKRGTLINAFHAFKYVNRDAELYLVKTTGEHSTAYLNVNIYTGILPGDPGRLRLHRPEGRDGGSGQAQQRGRRLPDEQGRGDRDHSGSQRHIHKFS